MAEILHDFDHVLRHRAETVIDVVGARFGQRTVAVTAKIGKHHVITLRKPRSEAMPCHVIARIAVQEQKRWPRTAVAQADDGAFRAHVEMLETGEQSSNLW